MSAPSLDQITSSLLGFVNVEIMSSDRPITAEDAFDEVGIDSLALLRILVFVESTFGLWIPDSDLETENVGSVDALARYLVRHRESAA